MLVPLSLSLVLRGARLASFYLLLSALKYCCSALWRLKVFRAVGPKPLKCRPGVSVIIPHHDDLEMLEKCLASVVEATHQVNEPFEILVVPNGVSATGYEELKRKFSTVRWFFSAELLEFARAVRCGLQSARFDWVYLLNDDMVLDPMALCEVLKWRGPLVFGLASHIFPHPSVKLREETGYTFYRFADGIIELDHRIPESSEPTERILYAGGGSSLFHRGRLIEFMGATDPYSPCYFEDAEWSVLAWKQGYEVRVCRESRVYHRHRVTHQRLFGSEGIKRIFERNACLFQLRNALYGGSDLRVCQRLWRLQLRSSEELFTWRRLWEILQARTHSYTFAHPLLGREGGLPPFRRMLLRRAWRAVRGRVTLIGHFLESPYRNVRMVHRNCTSRLIKAHLTLSYYCRLALIWSFLRVPRLADRLARALRELGLLRPHPPTFIPYQPGISVVVPERANPSLLDACLCSVRDAVANVDEPVEVIVVVNGSPRHDYVDLLARHPRVKWLFCKQALWFSGAIRKGLAVAQYDWVYLLNNDMIIHPSALSELIKWRGEHVFAVASQIYFHDPERRREETGWTQFRWSAEGFLEIFDAEPEDPELVRGTLYAGGGSSLCRRGLLQRFMGRVDPFHPFYWEDVEWGILAWKAGFEVLFCPTSKVWHRHRATCDQFFTQTEIQRIFDRNGFRFRLRHSFCDPSGGDQLLSAQLLRLEWRSLFEIAMPASLMGIVRSRVESHRYPFNAMSLQHVWRKYYFQPLGARPDKPLVVLVSPFALYPPAHGGAVRLHHLITALSSRFRYVILSDEGDAYDQDSWKYCRELVSLHLVTGRTEPSAVSEERISRILSHSHSELQDQLQLLATCYRPALVQIEFVELAKLIEIRQNSASWVVTLHDVLLDEKPERISVEDQYELDLIRRYDTVVACSTPDAALLDLPKVAVVPNGVDGAVLRNYRPSQGKALLFMGPFRYLPNLRGIELFLELIYPRLLDEVPSLELWILAGRGGAARAAGRACFQQRGVTLFDYIEQPKDYLERCALTLNPVLGVRGSSLKMLESVAAGRVCVSTIDGARGFLHQGWSSLVTVQGIGDFAQPLERLLLDDSYRHSIEHLPESALESHTWQQSAVLLGEIYDQLVKTRAHPALVASHSSEFRRERLHRDPINKRSANRQNV